MARQLVKRLQAVQRGTHMVERSRLPLDALAGIDGLKGGWGQATQTALYLWAAVTRRDDGCI